MDSHLIQLAEKDAVIEKLREVVVEWRKELNPMQGACIDELLAISNDTTALNEAKAKVLEDAAESFRITTWGHSIRHNEDAAGFLDRMAEQIRKGEE